MPRLEEQVQVELSEAYERGRVDFSFFSSLALPYVCRFELPDFYIAAWQLILNKLNEAREDETDLSEETMQDLSDEEYEDVIRFALGLPRGHAKTTFVKILISYLLVYDYISFPLIVCANSDLAKRILADIDSILSTNNMKAVYGDWKSSMSVDSKEEKKAYYHKRPIALVAVGWSSGTRGLNIENMRPDFILCDDVQTKLNDDSPVDREKLKSELGGSIFKAITPDRKGVIVYIGNMYSDQCLLNQFKNSPSWTSMVTGAILASGKALWPKLHPIRKLMAQYKHDESLGLGLTWFAEVMNDPSGGSKSLLPLPLPPSNVEEIVAPDGAFIAIDPAGYKKSSDDNVIVLFYKYDQRLYAVDFVKGILDPEQLIIATLRMAIEHRVSLIGVESVAYQMTLCFWMEKYLKAGNIDNINVVELTPKGRAKEARIRLSVQALYSKNTYILDPLLRKEYTWQAAQYKLGIKENKDDLLDAVAYGEDVRNEYWEEIVLTEMNNVLEGEARVVANNAPF